MGPPGANCPPEDQEHQERSKASSCLSPRARRTAVDVSAGGVHMAYPLVN